MDQNQRKTSSHPLGVMAPIAKRLLLLTLFSILLLNVNATDLTEGSCILNGHKFADRASWQVDCKNCTCLDRVPVCHEIQCKYEPCTNGKVFVLNEDQCCPSCEVSKNSCHYQQYLIEHNTEFSPKLCQVCKCKNGIMECIDSCHERKSQTSIKDSHLVESTSLSQRKERLKQHHHKHRLRNNNKLEEHYSRQQNSIESIDRQVKSPCVHDDQVFHFNATWSPIQCTQCRCSYNNEVDCYVKECPQLSFCPYGIEVVEDECCPRCRSEQARCMDGGVAYKNGDIWTKKNKPCEHCTCIKNEVKCRTETCQETECKPNEILVSKSNDCCPQCVSQVAENCEYNGRMHYNGEMWYNNGCEHCACDFGKVVCMKVQCESQFCLKDEIMVKKKDDCCIQCRQPTYCTVDQNLRIKENEFWSPENSTGIQNILSGLGGEKSCKLCQCLEGKLECYSKSCKGSTFPSYARIKVQLGDKTRLDARTIPFFADIIKSMSRDSQVFITSGPSYSSLRMRNKLISLFTVGDILASKVYYKFDSLDTIDATETVSTDYVVLSFVSADSGLVHNVLIAFEIVPQTDKTHDYINKYQRQMRLVQLTDRTARNYRNGYNNNNNYQRNSFNKLTPRKTIFVHPGEAIMLTSAELRPKNISKFTNEKNLIYYLVSGNLKYGELKLKKVISYDEHTPVGWNIVNDIYLEKKVTEFTQNDLDMGNVWYEPFNDAPASGKDSPQTGSDGTGCTNRNSFDCEPMLSFSSMSSGSKYDHCMFEVYDQEDLHQLISKEIIHFSIQHDVINETILGLEVIENQFTPLTFSNFDIAGIDSTREYLIYRVIKRLDKNQGQLEHSDNPGVSIDTFSQHDLNKGYILYHSPKEIGIHTKDFSFTFVVTNDNRSDTFPETPFHIKVSPANDQAPQFKEPILNLNMSQSGSLALSRNFFAVEDPDTAIDNMIFSVEKTAENVILELRARGQRYLISKDDSFTMQEVRDGTFRLIHNGATDRKQDTLKISVSDGKHITMKTINLNIQQIDRVAPYVANKHTSMILNVVEGQTEIIRQENMAYADDKSSPNQIIYSLVSLKGKMYLRSTLLVPGMKFTQADIDLKNLKYEAPREIGSSILTDRICFDVADREGNLMRDQVLTVNIEPIDNQAPSVEVLQPVSVLEGGFLVLNETYISVRDSDSFKEQLNVVIDSQPSFGYIENIKTGFKLTSFPLTDLINGQTIRYVQADHQNKEPKTDLFIFHVSDGINNSPTANFHTRIQAVNDEPPVALFEPLLVEFNTLAYLSNSTFHVVDFDSSNDLLQIYVTELPRYGILFLNDIPITKPNIRFFYSDVIAKHVSYRMTTDYNMGDEIKFRITDGVFSTAAKYFILKSSGNSPSMSGQKDSIVLESNQGLHAIAGHILPITSEILKAAHHKKSGGEGSYISNGGSGIHKDFLMVVAEEEESASTIENFLYEITESPAFGKLQFRFKSFYEDLTGPYATLNKFTQNDIDEGRVFYNHGTHEQSGVTFMNFRVTDTRNNVLNDQRFIITVRGDKLPPVVILNKELRIDQGKSGFLTKFELNVSDNDTQLENLKFYITTQPKLGFLENIREPGKRINHFNYNDLTYNRVRYIHNGFSLDPQLIVNVKDLFRPNKKEDSFDIKISDGKNDASTTMKVLIVDENDKIPVVKSRSGFSMRLKELDRQMLTSNELEIEDSDTDLEKLKVIVTNSPQYGVIEKRVKSNAKEQLIEVETKKANQALNFILKFDENQNGTSQTEYVPVNEFTMADINAGLVFYHHQVKGVSFDRFGFVIYDGVNKLFKIENKAEQTSNVQIFNINIDVNRNYKPTIEKNLGFDYLYQIDGKPGRLITQNELQINDKDDLDSQLIIKINQPPRYGTLESKSPTLRGMALTHFTQEDVNANKIFYVLKDQLEDDTITSDHFVFSVYDSNGNYINDNRFEISWSVLSFELADLNVMETDGKARVHVKKTGNLKQFSMVTCRTVSGSAKSNRDVKNFDYVQTMVRLEFNEDESYKACDVMIQRDHEVEAIESFYVILEDSKYSMVGSRQKIKVNILDKADETFVEFEKTEYEIQEFQRFISLPVVRVGDLKSDIEVECAIEEGTAHKGRDFLPRNKPGHNHQVVRIPAGERFGFCDIEIIDDDINEMDTETFKAVLIKQIGSAVKIGKKSEARVEIIGPNDVLSNKCNSVYYSVSESSNKFFIDITREESTLAMDTFEVLVTTAQSLEADIESYSKFYKQKQLNEVFRNYHNSQLNQNEPYQERAFTNKNVTLAKPNEDYLGLNEIVKFAKGETTKQIEVKILNDVQNPVMEGLKMFSVELKSIVNGNLVVNENNVCSFVNPDAVHIVIEDLIEDSISVGFEKTAMTVNEPDQLIHIPIIRNGDVSQPFSVICHTRHLTAINEKDFIGRYSLEKSRIYFNAGDRVKDCTVEIINDSIFEADEEFQVRLSDLRGPDNAQFGQYTNVLVKILNNEDSSVISFSQHVYHTEEPSSNDASIIKPITVLRTGDLSRTTIVRVSTTDDTAIAGIDYKPKTQTLTFQPGVSALDFDVEVFYDRDSEQTESFSVNLGPQDPVSGVFGEIVTANVLIHDTRTMGNGTSSDYDDYMLKKSFVRPYVTSLGTYLMNGEMGNAGEQLKKGNYFAASDKPLICLNPCHDQNPNKDLIIRQELCRSTGETPGKELTFSYGWEISTQDEFGAYSPYVKLTDNTLFSYVNQQVLEPIYYRRKFRVRCTTQLIRTHSDKNENYTFPIFKSNTIEIFGGQDEDMNSQNNGTNKGQTQQQQECSSDWLNKKQSSFNMGNKIQKNVISMQPLDRNMDGSSFKDNHKLDTSFIANLQSISEPFSARADYISADFIKQNPHEIDLRYLNYVRLVIDVPYMEGSFPLISTRPLFNYRLLLDSESDYASQHVCSNFIGDNYTGHSKYGFLTHGQRDENLSASDRLFKKYRNESTLNFFSNLDSQKCGWQFVAYYDISELTTNCQAQIISDSDIREVNAEKSYLTIKIPIYVSYIYPSYQASWSSIEYKSEIDAFIIYKTNANEEQLSSFEFEPKNDWYKNSQLVNKKAPSPVNANSNKLNHEHLLSVVINKISMSQEGQLIIEFTSVPAFRGQFVKYHRTYKNFGFSSLSGPVEEETIEFDLDLVWSQYTYDYPEQTWRATSNSVLNNYSGNYSLKLIPCYAKEDSSFKYPFDCKPSSPISYTIPIKMEQTLRPIPIKYTLDTSFVLSNSPDTESHLVESDPATADQPRKIFDGYFRKGDRLYGKVIWNGEKTQQSRKKAYKLELEQVFLCQSGSKQFIPFYDPDGAVLMSGPQFGCARPHDSLKHRFVVLDKSSRELNRFNAQIDKRKKIAETADAFKLDVDSLFDLVDGTDVNATNIEEHPWYIQVMYVISLSNSSVNKRAVNVYSLNNVYNNGTNMQSVKLTYKPVKYFEQVFQKQNNQYLSRNKVFSFKDVFFKVLLPIFILVVVILFTAITLVFYRKSIVKNKFWNIRAVLAKRRLAEFPKPMGQSTDSSNQPSIEDKNIYDNYENLMNLKRENAGKSPIMNKFQMFLNTSCLYTKRVKKRAFNRNPEKVENVSGSNSTSGTLIASPLLDNNIENGKLGSLLEDGQFQMYTHNNSHQSSVNFNYDYLRGHGDYEFTARRKEACEVGSNDEEEGEVNTKLSFRSIGLMAFIQKMNNRRRAHMKSIKRIHSQRSQFKGNSDNYDNAGNEASEHYKRNETGQTHVNTNHRQHRPTSSNSHMSHNNNQVNPSSQHNTLQSNKCRNNYLYFNYNNNKMTYLNGDVNNSSFDKSNLSGTLTSSHNKKELVDSTLYLNQLAEQHNMTTASAKMFVVAPSPHQQLQYYQKQQPDMIASMSSMQHIKQVSPHLTMTQNSTSVVAINKLVNRLSGTEV